MSDKMLCSDFFEMEGLKYMGLKVKYTKKKSGKVEKEQDARPELYPYYPQDKYDYTLFRNPEYTQERYNEILDKMKDKYNTYAVDTYDVFQIDVDFREDFNYPQEQYDFVENLKSKTAYYNSSTKRLPHLFFRAKTEEFKNKLQKKTKWLQKKEYWCDGEKASPIEILSGLAGWITKSGRIYNPNSIIELDEEDFKPFWEFNQPVKVIDKVVKPQTTKKTAIDEINENELEMLTELGNLIEMIDLDSYDDWCRIVWSLKNSNINFENLARTLSQKSSKYEDKSFNQVWSCSKGGSTIGTYLYYCKRGNEEEYRKIRMKYYVEKKKDFTSHEELARFFIETEGHNLIYNDEDEIYHFNETSGIWEKDHPKTFGRLHKKISKVITEFVLDYSAVLNEKLKTIVKVEEPSNEQKEEKVEILETLKVLNKLGYNIKCVALSNNVITMVKRQLSIEQPTIEFDMNPNLFSFTNLTFDLIEGKETIPKREDYQSSNSGYNYTPSTKSQRETLENNLFNTIFTDEEIRIYYKKLLATGLYGKNPQKFILANGTGGNGKGVLHNQMLECVGLYGMKGNADIFLNEKVRGGNPEVANLHLKRFAVFDEPATGKKINTAFLKEITGGELISARKLFSNNTKTIIHMTPFLETNEKNDLGGSRLGDAELRRILDIEFKSTFTDNEDLLDKNLPNVFKRINEVGDKKFKVDHRCALFDILIDVIKENNGKLFDNLTPPKSIRLRTEEYVEGSKELLNVIKELVEFEEMIESEKKKNIVSVSTLHKEILKTTYYNTLSRVEKKAFTPKKLKEYILSEVSLKYYYSDDKINYNGTTSRSSLCWCKLLDNI